MMRRWAGVVLIVVSAGWMVGLCCAKAGAQEFVAPVPQKPVQQKPVQQKSVPRAGQESLPDPNRAILEEANKKAKAAEEKALHSPSAPADPTEDPRYAAAYTDYAIWVLQHDRKSYEWHHTSSVIIFYVVIFLVLSGVWFSWMQFRAAHHHPVAAERTVSTATATPSGGDGAVQAVGGDQAQAATVVTEQKDSVTEFSASPQGIKVASSAIGVVILVISMCFFYLYLQKVYPITVMPPAQGGAAQAGGQ
jgi:hypothetical protein